MQTLLWGRDLAAGMATRVTLPEHALKVLTCALLQKYSYASRKRQSLDYPPHRCLTDLAAVCGQPLGIVRLTASDCQVYWVRPSGGIG